MNICRHGRYLESRRACGPVRPLRVGTGRQTMLTWKPHLAVGAKVASSAIVLAGMLALPAVAQDTYLGSREFAVSCAVCHGATGKGDGEMAKLLTAKPADLTVLAKNNGGE